MMTIMKSVPASAGPRRVPVPQLSPGARLPSVRTRATQQHVELAHREHRLLELADEFAHHWISGSKEGPTNEVLRAMATVCTDNIDIRSIHALGKAEFQGIDGLRDMLTLSQHREGGLRPIKACLCAANEEDDAVFCLMESEGSLDYPLLDQGEGQKEKEKEGGEQEKLQHKAYGLVKFDILLDDTSRCVTGLTERWQLAPADMRLMAVHMPEVAGADPGQQDKEAKFKAALAQCGAAHFPKDRIKETKGTSFDAAAAKRSMQKWCQARCSGQDEERALNEAFAKEDFLLWDAMGVLPMVCGIKPGFEHSTSPSNCIMGYEQVLDLIRNTKAKTEVCCTQLDSAVSPTHNIGFVHWRSNVHPKPEAEGQEAPEGFVLEGLELHVFSEQGTIRDIWMLRDPMKAEQEMLSDFATYAAPAAATAGSG